MTFEEYLARGRDQQYHVAERNARFADDMYVELRQHINVVLDWINANGRVDRTAMANALKYFGSRYAAKGFVYRGTGELVMDGKPASYTRKLKIAEGFAKANARRGKPFFVIKRRAPAISLDLSKLLRAYHTGKIKRSDEAEVILLNKPVRDKNITEYAV